MKKRVYFIMVLCMELAVAATSSFAEEKALSDEGEVSYVQTDGNSQVSTLSIKNLLKYKFNEQMLGSWKIGTVRADAYDATSGKTEKTAASYFTDVRLEYKFTPRFYSFVNAGWQRNQFAGIDAHTYGGVGAGYKILAGPAHFLDGELGVLYVADKYTDTTTDDYASGRALLKYGYAFTDKNKFSQSLEYLNNLEDSDRYFLNSETAVISALSDILSLKAAYVVNYTSVPIPATLEKKDSTLTVALVVNY